MDTEENEKLDDKVLEYQGKNKIAEDMREDESEDDKFQIFDSAIMDAILAAKDMYVEGEADLDETLESIISWCKKCKGKEKEYLKLLEDEDEDEEENEE